MSKIVVYALQRDIHVYLIVYHTGWGISSDTQ